MSQPKSKGTLLVISCSKSKLDYPAPASKLYQGQQFKALTKLANQNKWDLCIISGKLGLIAPDRLVKPYDQKLQNTKEDIARVQDLTLPKLRNLIPRYETVIVFMSKVYKKVIKPLANEKFVVVHHPKGIFGYNQLVYECLKLPRGQVISKLREFDGYYTNQENNKNKNTLERFLKWV